jgi:quinol monooxygenase YgiN
VLAVSVKLAREDLVPHFIELFRPVATHVREREPHTLSYELMWSDKDPLRALVFERYRNKQEDFLVTHRSSEPFLRFRKQLQEMQDDGRVVELSGESYVESNVGFV